jgi:hypothetical protein
MAGYLQINRLRTSHHLVKRCETPSTYIVASPRRDNLCCRGTPCLYHWSDRHRRRYPRSCSGAISHHLSPGRAPLRAVMVRGSSIAKLRLASRLFRNTGARAPRARLSRTRGNAAKPSPGIDVIGRAPVCSNAFAEPLAGGSRLTSGSRRLSQDRCNRSNRTKFIAMRMHTSRCTSVLPQTQFRQRTTLRKQEHRGRKVAAQPGSQSLAIQE